ncbi:MAG: hypothetical protein A4S09_01475 [Proteobacteria bacterium SG_bin7]|nr:MAG: hypothetical protein A4S09_01475 [Proteobacteria bacterium SG_bin7]
MGDSLLPFSKKRTFVLSNSATVAEAARTMEEHKVGCVVVSDGLGHICGIVTDRDLTCKVLAFQEDTNTLLEQVMSSPVVAIKHDQSLSDAIKVMTEFGFRRVPIIRSLKTGTEKCVGLVTLDQLIFRKLIPLKTASQVLKHRQENTLNIFYKVLAREMKVSRPTAVAVSGFLLTCLIERVSPHEAHQLIAELPKILQQDLLDIEGPNRKITPRFILRRLDEDFGFNTRASYQLVRGFWSGLECFLLGRQAPYILKQLPKELQVFFTGGFRNQKAPALAISNTSRITH